VDITMGNSVWTNEPSDVIKASPISKKVVARGGCLRLSRAVTHNTVMG